VVTGFRFLHRPGYGLDQIAEREIWSLRFDPAHDAAGKPMESKVLWKLEWPAFHYAKEHKLVGLGGEGALTPAMETAARNDAQVNHFPTGEDQLIARASTREVPIVDTQNNSEGASSLRSYLLGSLKPGQFILPDGDHRPPCKGSGPMNLDMHESLYRDCTPPDLSKVNTEAVVKRPSVE
jgi:hypothetical protein